MEHTELLIVGAGAAGIAAAKAAAAAGCRSIVLADRGEAPGGVLPQCAHRGFAAGLSGPEYVMRLMEAFPTAVDYRPATTVTAITAEKTARLVHRTQGETELSFSQLILASGCLEIPMGALPIAGTRPRGVYTAGQMQARMNLHGHVPPGPAVILGSGDLGLIMAMHLAQAGVPVAAMVEQKAACGGLARNRNALKPYHIPLRCGVTIREVLGSPDLEAVVLSDGTEIPCKTLLIAVGLRPDRTLVHGLENAPWLHLCGNCRTVHPMVEAVTEEGTQAGLAACGRIRGGL